jgi:hypothetical protein
MPALRADTVLWPCLHAVVFHIAPRKGDFVLCTRCDDYREVVASEDLEPAMTYEEIQHAEGAVLKRGPHNKLDRNI